MTALAGLLGAGCAAGILLFTAGLRGTDPAAPPGRAAALRARPDQRTVLRLCGAFAAAVLAGALTRWVAGAILTAAAVFALPRALGPDRDHTRRVARFEAVASWAEMLRDTLAAAAGLEQAITVTAPLAPEPIRPELAAAARALERGERLTTVLRDFGSDIDDHTADLVITALVLAAEQRARNLGELLGSLARAARDHAALRLRVEASRAQTRTAARITVGTTVVFAAGLVAFDRPYLTAYDGITGQLVLLAVGALFGIGFWWLTRLARFTEPARLLTPPTTTDATLAENYTAAAAFAPRGPVLSGRGR